MLKVISYYLAFTMFSIIIQFAIIDYIQANNLDSTPLKPNLNGTSQKLRFGDILKEMKPHALFYQTNISILDDNKLKSTTSAHPNTSVTELILETELSSTTNAYDILLFDENTTTGHVTSESPMTTTEVENITELSIFNKKNETSLKPTTKPNKKKIIKENCQCDLQYQVCDINCCCDEDCTENEQNMFNCTEKGTYLQENDFFCSAINDKRPILNNIDSLFCVAETNLPEKRNKNFKEYNAAQAKKISEAAFKWHDDKTYRIKPPEITPKPYRYGDSVVLLRNGSLSYIGLPFSRMNNYCGSRKPLLFLEQQKIKCNVILKELEMFPILKNVEETSVVSFTNESANSISLNCSTVHCTNWTVIVCNDKFCTNYNKSLHAPVCTGLICTNFAVNVEYVFNYLDSKIVNATLYLHTQTVTPTLPFLVQEVSVKFYLTNFSSINKVVSLSGHPGYIKGHPVIASYEKGNHSKFFFNGTKSNHLFYPVNTNGICIMTNITRKIISFGTNKRINCRYIHNIKEGVNRTKTCKNIQREISKLLSTNITTVISPLGNPQDIKDEDWLKLEMDYTQFMPYGEFSKDNGVLKCFNIVTKLSLIFGYADVSDIVRKEKIKILTAAAGITTQNLTFADESSVSVVLTVETAFVDVTKPPAYEYAGSPQLNIHLPKDFFFPFPSNKCYSIYECNLIILLLCIIITFIPK